MHHVRELTGDNYLQSPSGRQLKEAVLRFQEWQTQCPDWFERENLCLADGQDLPSLDEEVFEDPLLPPGGGIVKQQPLVRELPSDGCLVVDVCVSEEESRMAKLDPQLWPQRELVAHTLQSMVLPAEQVPAAHVVEPLHLPDGSGAAAQLPMTEDSEACPLLGVQRNSILCLPVDSDDLPLCSTPMMSPDHLQGDAREQLESLMLSVLQQSLSGQPLESWPRPEVVLEGCTPSEEEQRQSVQSDRLR